MRWQSDTLSGIRIVESGATPAANCASIGAPLSDVATVVFVIPDGGFDRRQLEAPRAEGVG
jgi:hypothetical protein